MELHQQVPLLLQTNQPCSARPRMLCSHNGHDQQWVRYHDQGGRGIGRRQAPTADNFTANLALASGLPSLGTMQINQDMVWLWVALLHRCKQPSCCCTGSVDLNLSQRWSANTQAFGKTPVKPEDSLYLMAPNRGVILIGDVNKPEDSESGSKLPQLQLPDGRTVRVPTMALGDGNVLCVAAWAVPNFDACDHAANEFAAPEREQGCMWHRVAVLLAANSDTPCQMNVHTTSRHRKPLLVIYPIPHCVVDTHISPLLRKTTRKMMHCAALHSVSLLRLLRHLAAGEGRVWVLLAEPLRVVSDRGVRLVAQPPPLLAPRALQQHPLHV
jgi:hypothetical protein